MLYPVISVLGDMWQWKSHNLTDDLCKSMGTIIAAGQHPLFTKAKYVCVNDSQQLDFLIKNRNKKQTILAPRDRYAKYVFHEGIECLPFFEDLAPYNFDPSSSSQQILCMAMACWIGTPVVSMFDFYLEKKEHVHIRAIMKVYSTTQFFFVNTKVGNTIGVFKDSPNFKQISQKELLEFGRKHA